jgi:TRAP-type transport system periplasmic protein
MLKFWKSPVIVALATIAAISFGQGSMADAATWRLSFKPPMDSPEGLIFQRFAELTNKYTDGRLTIKLFPSEQLGKAQAVLEQLSAGAVDIFVDEVAYLKKWSPEIVWTSAPYLFDNRDHLMRFWKSGYMHQLVAKCEKEANISVIGEVGPVLKGPYRVLVTKKMVENLDDIQGIKLRIWDNQLVVNVWTALGAKVRVLGWSDVYQSLQTGIVEAVTSPVSLVESMKFTELAPHIARTDEFSQASAFMVNTNSMKALSAKDREAVLRAYNDAGTYSHEILNRITEESLVRMKKKGATYVTLDTAPLVKRVLKLYEKMAKSGEMPAELLAAVEATR